MADTADTIPSHHVEALARAARNLEITSRIVADACAEYQDDRREDWWPEQEPGLRCAISVATVSMRGAANEVSDAMAAIAEIPSRGDLIAALHGLLRGTVTEREAERLLIAAGRIKIGDEE